MIPPLAALAGRVPLPCRAEPGRPVAAGSPLYCLLNRNYVDPRLVPLLDALAAAAMEQAYPGTVTPYLDANFPFLDGMPLAPHLSHDDGRKLDLAFFYADPGGALPAGIAALAGRLLGLRAAGAGRPAALPSSRAGRRCAGT